MSASLSATLCLSTLDAIVTRLGLVETTGADGGPVQTLRSPMMPDAPVGAVRVFRRAGLVDLVYVGLTVPMIGLDSHMMFAFTRPESAVPHFTLDSVMGAAGPPGAPGADGPPAEVTFAFHLDLIPKLDLGAHLPYLRHCFEPLTALRSKVADIEGLSPAHLTPTQYAVMSPWMLVHRATEAGFRAIDESVAEYRNHWLSLVEAGVPADASAGVAAEQIAARDRANRAIVFDPTVDPVWGRVARLLGDEQSESVRARLAAPMEEMTA